MRGLNVIRESLVCSLTVALCLKIMQTTLENVCILSRLLFVCSEIAGLVRATDSPASASLSTTARRARTTPCCLVRAAGCRAKSGADTEWEEVSVFNLSTFLRLGVLRRGRVGGWESELQHGDEQPHLPAVRGCERSPQQPGPGPLRALPAASVSQGVSWLLPAD